jgi:ATP dependent DNA ligase domain
MARSAPEQEAAALPEWIRPQLTQLVKEAPEGPDWLHEIKFDGYRMHARLDRGVVRLLTRTGLDWTHKYPALAASVSSLVASQAYLDGEFCGVYPDGITSFGMIQTASDAGNAAGLVYFIFDLLYLDGENLSALPLIERKARLAVLLSNAAPPLHYSDYHRGQGFAKARTCPRGVGNTSKGNPGSRAACISTANPWFHLQFIRAGPGCARTSGRGAAVPYKRTRKARQGIRPRQRGSCQATCRRWNILDDGGPGSDGAAAETYAQAVKMHARRSTRIVEKPDQNPATAFYHYAELAAAHILVDST